MILKSKSSSGTLTRAWLLLVAATLLAWWFSREAFTTDANLSLAVIGVLGLALVKVWVVGFTFMELRRAPPLFGFLFAAWAVGMTAALIGIALV